MIVEDTGSSFKPVPAGMHLARCYRIIDIGTQKTEFEGNVKYLHKIKIVWEVHGNDEDNNPMVTDKNEPMIVNKDYTLSWAEKANLRLDLQSWRGKAFTEEEQRRFDLKSVLDKWCMVNVTHKPKKKGSGVYANVTAITPVPSALKLNGMPKGHNPCKMFQISDPDMELFETFSDYLKKQIEESPEWKAKTNPIKASSLKSGFDDMPDDIPF